MGLPQRERREEGGGGEDLSGLDGLDSRSPGDARRALPTY